MGEPALHRYSQKVQMPPVTREDAERHVQRLLTADLAIVDFETTGLVDGSRIIEIGIVDQHGATLFDSLVNPRMPITPEATAVHGLTDADVAGTPTLWQVWATLRPILAGRAVLAWNAEFEARVLADHLASIPTPPIFLDWTCVMRLYMVWHGLTKRARLDRACWDQGIHQPVSHRALGDALTTQRLLVAMAGQAQPMGETDYQHRLVL